MGNDGRLGYLAREVVVAGSSVGGVWPVTLPLPGPLT